MARLDDRHWVDCARASVGLMPTKSRGLQDWYSSQDIFTQKNACHPADPETVGFLAPKMSLKADWSLPAQKKFPVFEVGTLPKFSSRSFIDILFHYILSLQTPYYVVIYWLHMDFPGGSVIKNLPACAGDASFIPGLGRSHREGNGNPLQYFCLEKPMDRGAWQLQFIGLQKSRKWLTK